MHRSLSGRLKGFGTSAIMPAVVSSSRAWSCDTLKDGLEHLEMERAVMDEEERRLITELKAQFR